MARRLDVMSYGTSHVTAVSPTDTPRERKHQDVMTYGRGSPTSGSLPVRIGILTGGGDCPGLNAVIRSVVRTATTHYGSDVVGFRDGWRGLLEDRTTPLDIAAVDGLLTRGGTTLGSARVAPERLDAGLAQMKGVLVAHGIDV